ncbi:hypothetical protein [Clostridioides sp. ES-S-0010-02]|uniref:hypothetical protein n=1 Tax=Clostridioides sp. ES-S-0010-02 TaxID=2770776 RepID=UPI001D10322F
MFFIVTYVIFTWAIKKLDIKTLGRSSEEVKLYSKKEKFSSSCIWTKSYYNSSKS